MVSLLTQGLLQEECFATATQIRCCHYRQSIEQHRLLMCGICGVISDEQSHIKPATRSMMRAMVHRGPDDEGYEELPLGGGENHGALAGFGFCRLSILDLSPAGHQPMFNPATADCLIFNGEIYNFRALKSQLESRGVVFRGSSDSEVLLHALSTWGEAAIEKLQGMFAFAFYDAKSRRILLARDPLGIKPLYVAALPGRLVFASEVQAVLASGLVPEDIDMAGIAGMLAYGAVQSPSTVFEHIRSFPAGCLQWIDTGSLEGRSTPSAKRYWNFPDDRERVHDDRATASEKVRQLLHDSVIRHLVADVPVGVFLSAGIDSTIIAAIAREYTPRVTAFTVGFSSVHGVDEVPLAEATARSLGIQHRSIELDAARLPDKWTAWLSGMDSPSIDGFNTYAVSSQLAREGVVVGLSGLGADELFGGYETFPRAQRVHRFIQMLGLFPAGLRSLLATGIEGCGPRTGVTEKLVDLVRGDPSLRGICLSLRRALSNRRIESLGLSAARVGLDANYLGRGSDRVDPLLDGDPFNTVSRMELSHYMSNTLLRDTDATSMQNSFEVRLPFLDLPLVNYVSALSGKVKWDGHHSSKVLLRQSFQEVLAPEISRRTKTGFSLPMGEWMRDQMRDSCEAALERLEVVPFLDHNEVRRQWQAFQQNSRSIHWSRPLSLVVLGHYLNKMYGRRQERVECVGSPE